MCVGFILLVISLIIAISFGSETTSVTRVFSDPASLDRLLALQIRLPRALLAGLAGGGLALVGASFQALTRNALAEPYVLGVSGGASLGASVAIVLGLASSTIWGAALIPIVSLAGGLLATLLVFTLAKKATSRSVTLLLAGVIINSFAAAVITLLKTLVSATRAQELLFWLTGFVDVPSLPSLVAVAIYVILSSLVLIADAGRLNVLSLGEQSAVSLGVHVINLERRVFFAASTLVGAIVSATGLIGFVGLVVPHAIRFLVGYDNRKVLPLSLLGGAIILIWCDLLARLLFNALGTEPPVGAITALLGCPIFLILLVRQRN